MAYCNKQAAKKGCRMDWNNKETISDAKTKTKSINTERANRALGNTPYFSMTPVRLVTLSLLTFGIYDLYWFYRNWKQIRAATDEKLSPFWRVVFTVFYIWPLFQRITDAAETRGYKMPAPPNVLSLLYVVGIIAGNALAKIDEFNLAYSFTAIALLMVTSLVLAPIQAAANFNNSRLPKNVQQIPRKKVPEIIVIAIGIIVAILAMIGWFVGPNKPTSEIPSSELTLINESRETMESLTTQYEQCSEYLSQENDKVDTSSQSAVDAYNKQYDNCENIRLKQNDAVDAYNALIAPYQ